MTEDEFLRRYWSANSVAMYQKEWRQVLAINFERRQLGLHVGDDIVWVSCKDVSAVTLRDEDE